MCVFCDIINKEAPAKIRYEDEEIIAFDDINPKAKVHILIVPKEHYDTLNDVPDSKKDILYKMLLIAKKLAKEFGIENGYKLVINCGENAGQVVFHLHMHLLGGSEIGNV